MEFVRYRGSPTRYAKKLVIGKIAGCHRVDHKLELCHVSKLQDTDFPERLPSTYITGDSATRDVSRDLHTYTGIVNERDTQGILKPDDKIVPVGIVPLTLNMPSTSDEGTKTAQNS